MEIPELTPGQEDPTETPEVPKLNPFQLAILAAMQNRPMYQGTVGAGDKERRRAKNRAAGRSRKINRKR